MFLRDKIKYSNIQISRYFDIGVKMLYSYADFDTLREHFDKLNVTPQRSALCITFSGRVPMAQFDTAANSVCFREYKIEFLVMALPLAFRENLRICFT